MRKSLAILIIAVTVATAVPAFADLQNVVVGGSVRIRGNWIHGDFLGFGGTAPIGGIPTGFTGPVASDNLAFVEQRTRLNVRADFTDKVSAFIELDSYNNWGENFRSDYLTGVDGRGTGDVSLYQGYIEASEMWGTGLKVRIGRQEIKLGSGWLVGTNDKNSLFVGLSFDGIRLTYATDQFSVDALWAKLAERSPLAEDGDIDLYGIYASYLGIENVSLDAYWLFIRDAANYSGSLDTHTVGLRGAGTVNAFDFEGEVAYQWLETGESAYYWLYRDHTVVSDALAANLEVGYTFDMSLSPRVYLGGAYFEGSDDDRPFNRLFSNWEYSLLLDTMGQMNNFWTARAGFSMMPTETLKVSLGAAYFQMVEGWKEWVTDWFGPFPIGETIKTRDDLGWEVGASVSYAYTKDLSFQGGYSHFFTGNALGDNTDDLDYLYFETKLCF